MPENLNQRKVEAFDPTYNEQFLVIKHQGKFSRSKIDIERVLSNSLTLMPEWKPRSN